MIVFASLHLCHYSWHTGSMPQKCNHDCKEKYPYIRVGTFVPIRVEDTFAKTVFLLYASVLEYEQGT